MASNVSEVEPARAPATLRRALVGTGWVYVGYHLLVVALGMYEAVSRYSDLADFLGEVPVGLVFYPVLLPALTMCGGLHEGCKSALGVATQLTVLGLTIAWSVTGWWVVIAACRRWIWRRRTAHE